jgi:hypothetical protein
MGTVRIWDPGTGMAKKPDKPPGSATLFVYIAILNSGEVGLFFNHLLLPVTVL